MLHTANQQPESGRIAELEAKVADLSRLVEQISSRADAALQPTEFAERGATTTWSNDRRFGRRGLIAGAAVAAVGGSVARITTAEPAAAAANLFADAAGNFPALYAVSTTALMSVYAASTGTGSAVWAETANNTSSADAIVGRAFGTGSAIHGTVFNTPSSAPAIFGNTVGTGPALQGDSSGDGSGLALNLSLSSNTKPAATIRHAGVGTGVNVLLSNSANNSYAILAGVRGTGTVVGIDGGNNGRGIKIRSQNAHLWLVPGTSSSHPASGQAGDLYVDKAKRLWFCKGGTAWAQIV